MLSTDTSWGGMHGVSSCVTFAYKKRAGWESSDIGLFTSSLQRLPLHQAQRLILIHGDSDIVWRSSSVPIRLIIVRRFTSKLAILIGRIGFALPPTVRWNRLRDDDDDDDDWWHEKTSVLRIAFSYRRNCRRYEYCLFRTMYNLIFVLAQSILSLRWLATNSLLLPVTTNETLFTDNYTKTPTNTPSPFRLCVTRIVQLRLVNSQ